jgi:hypothetical protein
MTQHSASPFAGNPSLGTPLVRAYLLPPFRKKVSSPLAAGPCSVYIQGVTLKQAALKLGTRYAAKRVTALAVATVVGGGLPGFVIGLAASHYLEPHIRGAIECVPALLEEITL